MEPKRSRVQVLVLGGGFGGLTFCQRFDDRIADVTIVDRRNHHLFQPLLYEVATAGLSAPDVAQPIRSILRHKRNTTVILDEVTGIDPPTRTVTLGERTLRYDYLVLALGAVTSYFAHPEWEEIAPGLKSLEDALEIRHQVLLAFERAEETLDPESRAALMTMAVIGGGATGVELAGALAELSRKVLLRDFRRIDPGTARVVLIEAGDRVLGNLPETLSREAEARLHSMGVTVKLRSPVADLRHGQVSLSSGEVIRAETVVWTAGVRANPLARQLGQELDRAGRVRVLPDLSLPGYPEVFVIGDMARVDRKEGCPVPGVSPAAIQMAKHVQKILTRECRGRTPVDRPPFSSFDRGTMATIGRKAAVAEIGPVRFDGAIAWLAWLLVHLIFLIGFRNKAAVLLNWIYSYATYQRGARIVLGTIRESKPPKPARLA